MTLFRLYARTLTLACLVSSALVGSVYAQNSDPVVDEIVAVVGDHIILRSEVEGMVAGAIQQAQVEYSDALWMEALNQIVDFKIMATHARRDTTIIVEDQQVEQALDQRIEQLSAQVGGRTRLEEMYGKSVTQIKSELREDFRDQLASEQFQGRKLQQIRITPSEVAAWFARIPTDSLPTLPEMVRVSHIVRYPKVTDEAREEARTILGAIRDSIVTRNASFESMADRFSDDPGSVGRGGHYGFTKLSDLEPEFAAVASRIQIGEISQIFETRYGPHILRVNDRRGDVIDFNHILIQYDLSEVDPTESIAFLNQIRDSIVVYDQPFELMARRHSEEEGTAARGGRVIDPRSGARDLPLAALGTSWQTTIAGLEEGEISEPAEVELLDGRLAYHILRLERRVPSHRVDLQTDYERIEEIALQEKKEREYRRWLNQLREDVYVEYRGKARELAVATD
ncbi:MAG TPA: peptidylprolyl isomerase [Rhodothermales bacterium]